ncbi:MAG: DUF1778 domain-containing protein [Candidatus Eremiobacteraeota bacterium]|nr:DUF1778 domain-containing protein [Candidatus Eremiobacteraeota bacterium]
MWQIDTHEIMLHNTTMAKIKPKSQQSARIHCRVSHDLKDQVESAARICGQSLTAFTETALAEKAHQVLQEQERILLSQKAFQAFMEAIHAPPPPPSAKLLAAVRDYQRKRSS